MDEMKYYDGAANAAIATDFAEAERWLWSAMTYWRSQDYSALTALLMSLQPGERLALELRMLNVLNGAMSSALGEDADEYVATALANAHAQDGS